MRKTWTTTEEMYLKEQVGSMQVQTIAMHLNRSELSIMNKMKRLGISNTKSQTGYLTTFELARLVNVDPSTVRGWICRNGLPYIRKTTRNSRKFYFIHPADFWEWAKDHKERVDFSKIECQSILPEPQWVNDERRQKKQSRYKFWSIKEEQCLMEMFQEGVSVTEIASRLKRSIHSILRKYERLESKYRV